jgi:hypothetical protein
LFCCCLLSEVTWNNQDRDKALQKIETVIDAIDETAITTEFIIVVLADTTNAFPVNPNPAAPLIDAISIGQGLDQRPTRGPYLGHWGHGASYDDVEWFRLAWNEGISLDCAPVVFTFNTILDTLV